MLPTAHQHAYCRGCGYCLFGQSARCSECGRMFDPRNPVSYSGPPFKWGWTSYGMAGLVVLFVAIIVAAKLASVPMVCY